MVHYAIIGLGVGDEGKSKVLSYFLKRGIEGFPKSTNAKPILVDRFHGSNNAGHTIVIGKEVYKMHSVPCGIIYPEHVFSLNNTKMFVNPRAVMKELMGFIDRGIGISQESFGIASKSQVTLDFHTHEDKKNFGANLCISILFPVFGYLTGLFSMKFAFLFLALLLVLYFFILSFFRVLRNKAISL